LLQRKKLVLARSAIDVRIAKRKSVVRILSFMIGKRFVAMAAARLISGSQPKVWNNIMS
jgi:hypothetical protein